MRPLKQQISITVDSDLLEKAKKLAEYDDRSLSQFINIALKEYINNIEKKQNIQ
jgi:metal-responsive CopG/Arc/MetJ family transcriptional regulator